MTKVLKSIELRKKLEEELIEKISNMGERPTLSIIRLGEKDEDLSYEKGLLKTSKKLS